LGQHHKDGIAMPRTQGGANTDLVRPLRHAIGHYTVDSDRREYKSDSRERPEEQQIEILPRGGVRAYLVHGANLRRRKLIAFEQ
jgi:predicted HD phosphohydrolase